MGDQRSENDTESDVEAELSDTPPQSPAAARLDVTGTQVCASTLASVSAAVVASFFGVAGTIAGAAVVSIIATTGGAVYGHGIRKTGAKLQQAQAVRLPHPLDWLQRTGATRDTGSPSAGPVPGPDPAASGWKHWTEWLSRRRWGLAAGVAIVFVASLATVTLVELVGQQPLASIAGNEPSGNTSIGSLLDDGDQDTPDDTTATTDPAGSSTTTDSNTPPEAPEPSTTTSSQGTETTEPSPPTTEE